MDLLWKDRLKFTVLYDVTISLERTNQSRKGFLEISMAILFQEKFGYFEDQICTVWSLLFRVLNKILYDAQLPRV